MIVVLVAILWGVTTLFYVLFFYSIDWNAMMPLRVTPTRSTHECAPTVLTIELII